MPDKDNLISKQERSPKFQKWIEERLKEQDKNNGNCTFPLLRSKANDSERD